MSDLSWSTGFALWILLAMAATWAWAKLVDGGSRRNRFVQRDHVAESKRRITRNGFKSKMGVK
jgi:hypothetical protein